MFAAPFEPDQILQVPEGWLSSLIAAGVLGPSMVRLGDVIDAMTEVTITSQNDVFVVDVESLPEEFHSGQKLGALICGLRLLARERNRKIHVQLIGLNSMRISTDGNLLPVSAEDPPLPRSI